MAEISKDISVAHSSNVSVQKQLEKMTLEETEKCFSYTWKVENVGSLSGNEDEMVESSSFVVDDLSSTKWKLRFYLRKAESRESIGVYLCRIKDYSLVTSVNVKYEIAFIGKDSSVLVSDMQSSNFERGVGHGFPAFVKREDVFDTHRSVFLPQNTLTVRCRMWKVCESMLQDVRCLARSRLVFEKRSFLWSLEKFSTLETEEKCSFFIRSLEDGTAMMRIDLVVTVGENSDEIISFELSFYDEDLDYFAFTLYLVDDSGRKIMCNKEEFWYDEKDEVFNGIKIECEDKNYRESENGKFSFHFTKQELLANKQMFLPNDVLSLQWDGVFSKTNTLDGIEEVEYGCTRIQNEISDTYEENSDEISHSYSLMEGVKYFYDNKLLCDVQLKTSTTTFQAHKIALSSASSVFKTMFSSSMQGNGSDCVSIEDLNDETLKRMLDHIYTSNADLTWESAFDLYNAADKYGILSLKKISCTFIKENLSTSNVREVLLFVEKEADDDLRSAAFDYLSKHGKDMANSEWRQLINANGQLAAEALFHLFYEN